MTPVPGFTPETLNVHPEIEGAPDPVGAWRMGGLSVKAHAGRDGLWIVTRKPDEAGQNVAGLALRTFPVMGDYRLTELEMRGDGGRWRIDTHSGTYRIDLHILGDGLLRMTSALTPSQDLLVAFWPRDLYPLDANDDPRSTRGRMEAAQRGVNAGYAYYCHAEPEFGNVLYMQNFTRLNPFFRDTKSKPDAVVGGQWPELGYLPPAAPLGNSPPVDPLKAGVEYVISDVFIAVETDCAEGELKSARRFVDLLARVYPHLDKPEPKIHDWRDRARRTLHDLKTAPEATIEHYGHKYLHPYTAAEYPDSMVQMTVLATLREYEMNYRFRDALSDELAAGMRGFYDDKLKTLRRYLPNVGADKNRDAVDSWYLYHPLMNLARLALDGEDWAKALFFDALDFVIRAAQHFNYCWPVIYDLKDFSVVCQARDDEGLGQTDAGGIYAYVMLQAHQLSGDTRYIDEAKKALKALEGYRFELVYQTNLSTWGAVACLKLFKLEGDRHYLDQSLVFLAGFLHNCELWQSEIGNARHYANFFGVTCLHDAPYMAAYEAFECFMACDEYLQLGGEDITDAVRLLLCEYWRYTLDVLWGFYPDALPPEALATTIRNGHIDRNLSFPLEDLYGDGQPAGQVGQEIYGAGAAFVLASRAYAVTPESPFVVFCEYPFKAETGDGEMRVCLVGPPGLACRLRLLPRDEASPVTATVTQDGKPLHATTATRDFHEYRVAAGGRITISWQPAEDSAV